MISSRLHGSAKVVFGTFVLFVVNIIWVLSSEVSHYIYVDSDYNKPFFTTYLKTCMFSLLLAGFLVSGSWRAQCKRQPHAYSSLRNLLLASAQSFWVIYYGLLPGLQLDLLRVFCSPEPLDHKGPPLIKNRRLRMRFKTMEDGCLDDSDEETYNPHPLSDPVFEPIRVQCTPPSSHSCSSCSVSSGDTTPVQGRVKFSSLVEVRSLSDSEESRVARMSYTQGVLYKRNQSTLASNASTTYQKLSLLETMRVALTFAILSFFGGWAYSEALALAEPSVVNVISATSGIFVCVLAALFPSNQSDQFTFSKLAAAFLSAVGVVLVTMSSSDSTSSTSSNSSDGSASSLWNTFTNNNNNQSRLASSSYFVVLPTFLDSADQQHLSPPVEKPMKNTFKSFLSFPSNDDMVGDSTGGISSAQLGVVWALMGAFVYSVYLVTLKHQVGNEENLNIAMFYGFVGVFNMVLIGPGLYVFDTLGWESFELPEWSTLGYIVGNGLIGTVLSEFLWLWGCFLTSSLAATLSLSMTTPLSMLTDALFRDQHFSWHLYVGSIPVILSFFLVTIFQQYNNWDPLGNLFHRMSTSPCSCCPPSISMSSRDTNPIHNPSSGSAALRISRSSISAASCGSRKLKRAARGATNGLFGNVLSKKSNGVKLKVDDDLTGVSSSDEESLIPSNGVSVTDALLPSQSAGVIPTAT